jgi:hypothetical protein
VVGEVIGFGFEMERVEGDRRVLVYVGLGMAKMLHAMWVFTVCPV